MENEASAGRSGTNVTRRPRPTLRTIAEKTGLALTTVSRALRDGDDVSAETKRLVRKIADEVGYRPDRAGVRLRTGKTNVVSLILSTEEQAMIRTAHLISSVASALRETPYHMIVTPYFPTEDVMAPIHYVYETNSADGVIINQTQPDDPRIRFLVEKGIPFASHGRTDMGIDHAYLDYDVERFCAEAVDRLVALGRRRLCLIGPPPQFAYRKFMETAFLKAAQMHGVGAEVMTDATSYDEIDLIQKAVFDRMTAPEPPDAYVASTPTAAIAAIAGIEALGLVLTKDVDLAAREVMNILPHFRPGILVAHDDLVSLGQRLAAAVIARIDHPDDPPVQALVPSRWASDTSEDDRHA